MKDKLTKNGHKKAYYRFFGALRGIGFTHLGLVALSTPVLIAVQASSAETRADTASSVVETSHEEIEPTIIIE